LHLLTGLKHKSARRLPNALAMSAIVQTGKTGDSTVFSWRPNPPPALPMRIDWMAASSSRSRMGNAPIIHPLFCMPRFRRQLKLSIQRRKIKDKFTLPSLLPSVWTTVDPVLPYVWTCSKCGAAFDVEPHRFRSLTRAQIDNVNLQFEAHCISMHPHVFPVVGLNIKS
jgi:hypothetical protein